MPECFYYLDNAATTHPCPAAIQQVTAAMQSTYGNPSSLHRLGVEAARLLCEAREHTAALLGCEPESIVFTSGGSEANNMALFGAANARKQRHIVVSGAEHSSVSATLHTLAERGWEVSVVAPNRDGTIDATQMLSAVRPDTALVSMMMVNNETGAIFPVEEVAARVKQIAPRALIHCDGVQALGKLPLKVSRLGVDFMSVSGHKLCAPKGVGALYIKKGVHIAPLIHGGGQERAMRSGTENVPMIAGFGAACAALLGKERANLARARERKALLCAKLAQFPRVVLLSPEESSPYIVSFSVPGYRGETLLHFLESKNVYVSSGSACAKGAASSVLASMGLPREVLDGTLRVSFIYDTEEEAVHRLIEALGAGLEQVAHV